MASAHKVRVRWPYPRTGRLMLAAIVGALCGIMSSVAFQMILAMGPGYLYWTTSFPIYTNTATFTLFIIGLLWAGTVAVRARDAFFTGCVVGASFVIGRTVGDAFTWPADFLMRIGDEWWMGVFALAGFGLAGGGAAILLRWMINFIFGQLIEQDGTRCGVCAYPVGKSGSERCPECGALTDQSTRRYYIGRKCAARLQYHWRTFWVVMCLVAVLIVSYNTWFAWPYWRFEKQLRNGHYTSYIMALPPKPSNRGVNGNQWLQIVAQADSKQRYYNLQICFGRQQRFDPPTMIIRCSFRDPSKRPPSPSPYAQCRLPSQQTAQILRHGLPRALEDALVERVREARNPDDGTNPKNQIVIDADPYFPDVVNRTGD